MSDIHLYLCLSSPNLRLRLKPPDVLTFSLSFSAVDDLSFSLREMPAAAGDLLLSTSFSLDEGGLDALKKEINEQV